MTTSKTSTLLDDLEKVPEKPGKAKSRGGDGVSGKTIWVGVLAVFSLLAMGYVVYSTIASYTNNPARAAFYMTMMDSENGEVFKDISINQEKSIPFTNPKTGKKTLYPVEECRWTKDGKAKLEPTFVILNERLGKPGKTICPDCGRTVVRGNPFPPDALMQRAWDEAQRKK